MIYLWLWF